MELPLVAPSTVLAEPWQGPLTRLLASEGFSLSDLKILGLRRPFFGQAPRSLFMNVSGARFGAVEEDEVYSKPARRFFKRVVTSLAAPRGLCHCGTASPGPVGNRRRVSSARGVPTMSGTSGVAPAGCSGTSGAARPRQ